MASELSSDMMLAAMNVATFRASQETRAFSSRVSRYCRILMDEMIWRYRANPKSRICSSSQPY